MIDPAILRLKRHQTKIGKRVYRWTVNRNHDKLWPTDLFYDWYREHGGSPRCHMTYVSTVWFMRKNDARSFYDYCAKRYEIERVKAALYA